jgi:hypothetical protein
MTAAKSSKQASNRDEDTTSQAGGQPKVLWDDSNVRSAHANAFNVIGGREEIALLFGRKQARDGGQSQPEVRLTDRIVMNPFAAKRLTVMLNSGIRDYEDKYGPLEGKSPPSTAREQMEWLIRNPPFSKTDRIAEKAVLLLQRIKDLDIEVGYERSFKMFDKNLLGNRFLFGIKIDTIRERAHEIILDMCGQLEMPANLLENFQENLPEANVVGVGFDESERSSVCKVYLEFGASFKEAVKKNPHRPAPFVLHRGFKWDLQDTSKCATARYTCFSFLPMETLLERVSDILDPHEHGESLDLTKDVVGAAGSRISHRDILYLELTEDNSSRRSFDINLYRANMQLKELYPILSRMCRHYSIPSEAFQTLYDPVKTEIFGHLAGGIDRDGEDFLTVYYGVEGYYIP